MAQERKMEESTFGILYERVLFITPLQYSSSPTGGTLKRQIKLIERGVLKLPDDANLVNSAQDEVYKYIEEKYGQFEVSQSNLDNLSTDQLLATIEADESTTTKAKALEILLAINCKEHGLGAAIYRQLVQDRLPISWRNSLLLALEHLQIEKVDLRQKMGNFLLQLCPNMKNEAYPRSRSALAAAVRTLPTLLDDGNQVVLLLRFFNTEYPTKIRRIVLLGIQSMASLPTPGNISEKVVDVIDKELVFCARYLLRCSAYPTSEEEFDLGLDVIDTLIMLGYDAAPSLICELKSLHVKWVVDQLKKSLLCASEMWKTRAPSFYEAKKDFIAGMRKAIDSICFS